MIEREQGRDQARAPLGGAASEVVAVLPSYDVAGFVSRVIRSLLLSGLEEDQILVVDDGSTDGTGDLVRRLFPQVVVLAQENRGLAAARNAGAEATSAPFILFLDADDRLVPGAIAEMLAPLQRGDAAVVVPNHRSASAGTLAWPAKPAIFERKDLWRLLLKNPLLANCMVERTTWESIRFREDLRSSEDLRFFIDVLLSGRKILRLAEPGVVLEDNRPGSLTSDIVGMRRGRRLVFEDVLSSPSLTRGEATICRYQLLRTSVGEIAAVRHGQGIDDTARSLESSKYRSPRLVGRAARRLMGPRSDGTDVLHVRIEEPGGAASVVSVVQEELADRFSFQTRSLPPRGVGQLPALFGLRRALKRSRGTVTHSHGSRAALLVRIARLGVRGCGAHVTTVHGLHIVRRASQYQRSLVRWLVRLALSGSVEVLAMNASDERWLSDNLPARVRVLSVPPAFRLPSALSRVDARKTLGIPSEDRVVVWAGRFVEQKDPLLFLDVVAHLGDAVHILMLGTGPLQPVVDRSIKDRGLQVRLMGWMSDPSHALAATDVVVSTSQWEGLPLGLVEALAQGARVVATDVPGHRDLARWFGEDRVRLGARDPRELAQLIHQALETPNIQGSVRDAIAGLSAATLAAHEEIYERQRERRR